MPYKFIVEFYSEFLEGRGGMEDRYRVRRWRQVLSWPSEG